MTQDTQQLLRLFGRLFTQRGFAQSAMWTLHSDHREGDAPRGQLRVLRLIAQHDHLTNADIVEALDIRPSSASAMVAKLEDAGLVSRTPYEEDGRVQLISLTDDGKAFIESARDDKDQLADKMFAGLTAEEQAQLTGLMLKLVGSLENGDQDAAVDAYFEKLGQFGPRRRHGHHGYRQEWGGGPRRGFGGYDGRPDFGGRPHGPQGGGPGLNPDDQADN
ncbi:MarR family transcriptional regulator [Lacticaseibacillus hegangensis]|uniref:MarR family transcriptional regulator n=1 Tax=Lacticaseibacillus hegangensis TaxID=2486010 RepID=A0ABW4CX42_9LACO|nr:MarR family transcriptional regulator [Lacticaseibacillus hegangensis]